MRARGALLVEKLRAALLVEKLSDAAARYSSRRAGRARRRFARPGPVRVGSQVERMLPLHSPSRRHFAPPRATFTPAAALGFVF